MSKLLSHIDSPEDLRKLKLPDLTNVASELRDFIIEIVATKEGHLGASLGVVELTIAIHYVFNTPSDLLIWDVGHQAYGHKILTGRRDVFHTNRQLGGLSGFPKRSESEFDTFGVGHSSTSISAALGMAIASQLQGLNEKQHIAVIGDASIASGMAFEGLNHAGVTDANLLVILNDNAIGIDPSVGALKQYLTNVKKTATDKDNIFEALNFNYSGPIDGHDLTGLVEELERQKSLKGPRLLHVITTKGKGLKQAEKHQVKYHAPGRFDPGTGELIQKETTAAGPKFQDVFGHTLVELAKSNKKIVGITPAMPTGSSMKFMMDAIPERAFDVGIAEQHAVTLAAGMSLEGMIPFCNVYSTFLQRAYDQLIHDVALQKIPVIFCLDRAGIVGKDGATHHGVFDLAYLRCVPNMIIAAPSNEIELRNLMFTAQHGLDKPMAIRYPRGSGMNSDWKQPFHSIKIGEGRCLKQGNKLAILSLGSMVSSVSKAIELLDEKDSEIGHYDLRFVKPLDETLLHKIFQKYEKVLTVEDGVKKGGFGSAILEFAAENDYTKKIELLGIPDQFIDHGTTEELMTSLGLDPSGIALKIKELI